MKCLQILLFCTAIWLVRTELTSGNAVTISKEDNSTSEENSLVRGKRAFGQLTVITFNIQTYIGGSCPKRDHAIIDILSENGIDLIVLQEMRNVEAARHLLNLLNQRTGDAFGLKQSGPLSSSGGYTEFYAFIYRRNILRARGSFQFPHITFSNGNRQSRPPFSVMFEYIIRTPFRFYVLPVHTTPDKSVTHTTGEEINSLHENMNRLLRGGPQITNNVIILGDFNQAPRYVGTNFKSALDQDDNIKEVEYAGSSSLLTDKPTNQLDRIYVHGDLVGAASGATRMKGAVERATRRLNDPFFCARDISDHYPLSFEINTSRVNAGTSLKRVKSGGNLPNLRPGKRPRVLPQ